MEKQLSKKVAAIIVAAGESRRMSGIDKMFAPLGGEPVIMRATRPFQECPLIQQIVVVAGVGNQQKCRHLTTGTEWSKVSDVCIGGRRRQDSVAAGLKYLQDCGWVVIHDGARPLVTVDLIAKGIEAAAETGAAVAAVPVKDTIKAVTEEEIVLQTLPRQNLRLVQTPQVFRIDIVTKAYQQVQGDVTDDASLVEQAGSKVKLYTGSYDNIKITTPEDLALAELLWGKRGH
jgi:2-C-methyl-D-erythritol 4-phosphate cytidylyltransferase